jgi:hypothetical protein
VLEGAGWLNGVTSPLHSKPLNERFYEKVIKVKADVAAVLNIFRTNQVQETLVDAIHRFRASIRTLSGPLLGPVQVGVRNSCLLPAFRSRLQWGCSLSACSPFSWPATLPLLSAPTGHGAAVHTPLPSPTAGAVTPPASVPPLPPLSSSHSFLRARRAAVHTVVSPCRVRTAGLG